MKAKHTIGGMKAAKELVLDASDLNDTDGFAELLINDIENLHTAIIHACGREGDLIAIAKAKGESQ